MFVYLYIYISFLYFLTLQYCIGFAIYQNEFQEADSNSCLSSKGGNAETKGEKSSNVSADIGKGPGSLLRNIHNNAFKFFCSQYGRRTATEIHGLDLFPSEIVLSQDDFPFQGLQILPFALY